ncbi:hypothetical protein HY988_03650 [Candidatus Micrarchaeota archaeon]|nr:hypothetical protein [Candidatus Micrarchaeota archaeon]
MRNRKYSQKIGLAGTIAIATFAGFHGRANAEEPAHATEVRPYPNFSGEGMHGNPAIWPQYGNWGYLELGLDQDSKLAGWLMLSSKLGGKVHGVLSVNQDFDAKKTNLMLALAFPISERLFLGGALLDSAGNIEGKFGLAHIYKLRKLLWRSGIEYDAGQNGVKAASELRFLAGPIELTLSLNANARFSGSGVEYNGQGIGGQFRYGDHLLSAGAGGRSLADWKNLNLHYRFFINSNTMLDVFVSGKLPSFSEQRYISAGVTRLW